MCFQEVDTLESKIIVAWYNGTFFWTKNEFTLDRGIDTVNYGAVVIID